MSDPKLSPEVEAEISYQAQRLISHQGHLIKEDLIFALRAQRLAGRADHGLSRDGEWVLASALTKAEEEIASLRAQVETLTRERDEARAIIFRELGDGYV